MRSIAKRKMESIFRAKNVLVSLHTENGVLTEEHLIQMKNGFDEWYHGNSTYSANIEKINGNSILVVNYIVEKCRYLSFFSV
jgi:hypothetical protein